MSDENAIDPVEIEIPSDSAPEGAIETEKKPQETDPEVGMEDLKAQLDAYKRDIDRERKAREQAELRAYQNERMATSAALQAESGKLTAITNAIRAVSADADAAEKALAEALSAGDTTLAAKAQRHLAAVEARLLQLENGKSALEEQLEEYTQSAKNAQQQQREPIPQRRPSADPVEEWAQSLSEASAAWVRKNADALRDQKMLKRIDAAHRAAVDLEGIEPETKEYFDYIEQRVGLKQQSAEQPRTSTGQFAPKKPVPAAPIAAAGQLSNRGSRGETMTLSAEMREIAHYSYPDLPPHEAEKQYALDRAHMLKTGRLS